MVSRSAAAFLSGIVLSTLVACSGSATPSPSSGGPSAPAPSVAAPSVEASAEAPSVAPSVEVSVAPPSTEPSIALPSFQLPSNAKDLEALLPSKMCDTAATKLSQTGPEFLNGSNNEEFLAILGALGKTANDVAYALSIAGTTGCGAGIFRVKGVDSSALQSAMTAAAQQSGDTFTDANVGGKSVKVQASGSSKSYFYIAGDAVLFAVAKDDAQAATILQQMP